MRKLLKLSSWDTSNVTHRVIHLRSSRL
ncbi:hypothetical protein K0U07_01485 [bacterium]|nr:hypothetical protein [bacterium]